MPFVPPPRFEVDACWGIYENGEPVWVPIYRGDNEKKAIDKADFWDDRVDVRFIDWSLKPWREQLNRKFDALEEYIRNYGRWHTPSAVSVSGARPVRWR